MPDRRQLIGAMLATAALPNSLRAQNAPYLGPNRLVLLGNKGGPSIRAYAPSPSCNLLVWNGVPYVIDAGYGVTFKLVEAGFPLPSLRSIFVTHNHSDHNLEAGMLPYNAWAVGLKTPVDVYGPKGIEDVINGTWLSDGFDIDTRMKDEGRPDLRKLVTPHVYSEGEVMRDADVVVTALRVKHPPITEAFAFKFAFPGKTIVFSGDTTYFPPLADFAKGADILVHEVAFEPALVALAQRNPNAATMLDHLKAAHTMTADVGRIAAAAGVKTLVLNHFVPADDKSLTEAKWRDEVATTFSGPIVVGHDLLSIPLG